MCQAAAMAVFLVFVQPANLTMVSWPLDAIPPEWARWRAQWEYGHAARALLETAGFAALVLSVLRETPPEPARPLGELAEQEARERAAEHASSVP